ncbi:hypothetical protein BN14_09835 [Rhizoctonia solani AG-1 IB]|uniref:Uncharacterized protein n=1 Tax=Thanatephorus cucumeris (strain AG1-IB / isolate 7/3/14) TaxID=1108050 RepID=M5C8E4_THACB|nr:hypothetical protein BN14_09835 [Rhizoctonia solani AG-1 IB]
MSAEPTSRLSKRESSTTLRRDTLATSARKRSGSNASTTSKASLMFTSPAKGFGLTRKASTATLSVAPVSVTGGLDHSLGSAPKTATIEPSKGKAVPKARPVRQSTRAEESLRGVQARTPISAPDPEMAPLSESPKNIPAPLPDDTAPAPVSVSPASSTKVARPKSRTSMIPVFVGSPERTKTTSSNLSNTTPVKSTPSPPRSASPRQLPRSASTSTPAKAAANRTQPPSTSPRSTTSKFRAPTMSPGHGLTRKASTSSIRSVTNGFRPAMSSPLAAGSKPAPPAPPKLDTGSVSAKIATSDPSQPSPSSASWLSSISGIGGNKTSKSQPTADIVASPVETSLSPVDNKASSSGATPTPKPKDQSPVSPTDTDHDGLVLVTAPTSPIATTSSHTYQINSLAAQHASSWTNAPAGWLAWISSAPALPTRSQPTSPITQDGEVMNVDSDEDEVLTEDNGQTPAMTPGVYDGQRMWGWGGKVRMSEESRISVETERQAATDGKGKRPAVGNHTLSVDSEVPALPSGHEDSNGLDYVMNHP